MKHAGEEQVEHVVVLPDQVRADGGREVGDAPKEVLLARGGAGGAALLEALAEDLEYVLDVNLDLDVDRASKGAERAHD
jgi:hypothetical protein